MTEKRKVNEASDAGMNKKVTRVKATGSAEAVAESKVAKSSKKAKTASPKARKTLDNTSESAGQVTKKPAPNAVNELSRKKNATLAMESGRSKTPQSSKVITAQERWRMISENAYYRAERRGFLAGNPAEDWVAAEAEIDAELVRTNTVVEP